MDDLVAFLKARLDEDEQVVLDWQRHKQALTERFMADPRRKHVRARREPVTDAQISEYAYNDRFGPARALREIQAKRKRLDLYMQAKARKAAESRDYQDWLDGRVPFDSEPTFDGPPREVIPGLEVSLRIDALAHDDHEDYRAEWRP